MEIFIKEENIPFSGDHFYNPYEDFSPGTLKANFHAHSNAWFYMTDGTHDPDEIYSHYKKNGYDKISISDYQKITTDKNSQNYIPVYEHGYNFRKSHQLVINPEKVNFTDFSIFLNYHTRQQVINMLRSPDGLIALAHPNLRNGYRVEDMKYLKGYDFIEVFNRYNTAAKLWDAALTSGYPAWIFSNDDCHDISRPDLTFNNWTRISSSGQTRGEVLSALKRGCFYGVRNPDHIEANFLDSCIIRKNELSVSFRSKADTIKFISDNGAVRKEITNCANASYTIAPGDSYVRVEAISGAESIYLNPVIRYDGKTLTLKRENALVNMHLTILVRGLVILTSISILLLILMLNGKLNILFQELDLMRSKKAEIR